MLLNYDKNCMLCNEYYLYIYADSQIIKRRVDDIFINYCKEKL